MDRPSWYRVELTRKQISRYAALVEIRDTAQELFIQLGKPSDMAVFLGHTEDQCTLPVYFSPAIVSWCSSLIELYSGSPCEKPIDKDLQLLAGPEDGFSPV